MTTRELDAIRHARCYHCRRKIGDRPHQLKGTELVHSECVEIIFRLRLDRQLCNAAAAAAEQRGGAL